VSAPTPTDVMALLGALLPVTAVVAVLIFVAREILEFVRRRRAERRKLAAIKRLVARELELNNWSIEKVRQALTEIQDAARRDDVVVEVRRLPTGTDRFIRREKDADDGSHFPVPVVHDGELRKYLLDIATLDAGLLKAAEAAVDGIAELRHVRESLVSNLSGEEELFPAFLESFAEYGLAELEDVKPALAELYRQCTGFELTKKRLR
jgi:hypothetical protein